MKQLFEYLNTIQAGILGPDMHGSLGNIPAESFTLLFLSLFSAWIFCPLLALLAKTAEITRKKTLYNNFARQTAQAGLIAALPTVLAVSVLCVIYGYISGWHNFMSDWDNVFNLTPEFALRLSIAAFAAFLLLQSFILLFWQKQRKKHLAQFLTLAAAASAACLAPLSALYALSGSDEPAAGKIAIKLASLPYGQSVSILFACIALAASWIGFWILIRRNKNDFGRDYYNFALRRCAWTAFIPALICAVALILHTSGSPLAPAVFALQALCCVLWFRAARSAAPLRHKAAFWLCPPAWAVSLAVVLLPVVL
ncbi:MAG: hypothetical protein LBM00_02665 [Deltaproteobacteria bacterium]|jgi:hypothetical protein|nr:hypothetical protein [Deltaproteobacteria bacterium]